VRPTLFLQSSAVLIVLAGAAFVASQPAVPAQRAGVPVYGYRVIHTYPHDGNAFTQGLEFRAGFLYEGTGIYGRSSLRKVKLQTGEVLQQTNLDPTYFGEGITVLNERISQLTWQTQTGFVYEQLTFKPLRQFQYPGEGWGLANDGSRIYMSDGTSQIRFWDAMTYQETGRITVRDGNTEIKDLNELEYYKGEILANVWLTDRIVRFSPKDGRVTGWIDLKGILPAHEHAPDSVLNGIAYDSVGDRLFVTGKLWPKLFEIQLVPRPASGGTRKE
jgi:glutaminyl-peptide cyclotransferase